jgi:hypothetical protein
VQDNSSTHFDFATILKKLSRALILAALHAAKNKPYVTLKNRLKTVTLAKIIVALRNRLPRMASSPPPLFTIVNTRAFYVIANLRLATAGYLPTIIRILAGRTGCRQKWPASTFNFDY